MEIFTYQSTVNFIKTDKSDSTFKTPEGVEGVYLGDVGDDMDKLCYVLYQHPGMDLVQREYKSRVIFD